MRLKTILFLMVAVIIGIVISSYFVGSVLLTRVVEVAPFSTLPSTMPVETTPGQIVEVEKYETFRGFVQFITADIEKGWIPWVIKQTSILIGALSLIVFFYAGISLIVFGDNEEQFSKSSKMILVAIIGIALSAFSYTIIANVLALFPS